MKPKRFPPLRNAVLLGLALVTLSFSAFAQFTLRNANVQAQADGVLTLMTYTVVPDVTTSTLSIKNVSSGDPGLTLVQFGGGSTLSQEFPIYLEGALGYSRYDPKFTLTNGSDVRFLPIHWNSVSASGGIGWDFSLNKELVLRPIVNVALGAVASDLKLAEWYIEHVLDKQINFLKKGALTAYGLGGSLMLDWERVRSDYELDLETRYSYINLQTFGNTDDSVKGSANVVSLSVWGRYRAPTGLTALDRPLRYVLETAHTRYFGSQNDALGFDNLTSLGLGLELDTSAHDIFLSRIRLVARRIFSANAHGASVGLAASF